MGYKSLQHRGKALVPVIFKRWIPGGGGGGASWVNFCWVCAAGLSEPIPHYSLFLWPIVDPILVTFGKICNLRDPNLVTFYLRIYLINPLNRSS